MAPQNGSKTIGVLPPPHGSRAPHVLEVVDQDFLLGKRVQPRGGGSKTDGCRGCRRRRRGHRHNVVLDGGREVVQTIAPVSALRRFLTTTKRPGERKKSNNGTTPAVRLAPLRATLPTALQGHRVPAAVQQRQKSVPKKTTYGGVLSAFQPAGHGSLDLTQSGNDVLPKERDTFAT